MARNYVEVWQNKSTAKPLEHRDGKVCCEAVVLCDLGTEYVTWAAGVEVDTGTVFGTQWGHYFPFTDYLREVTGTTKERAYAEAKADFVSRVQRGY